MNLCIIQFETISETGVVMDIKKKLASLQEIIAMGEELLTTFDIESLLDNLVEHVCELLNAEGCTLYLVDPIEDILVSQSIQSSRLKEITLKIDGTSIAGYTALKQKSLNIPDAYADLSTISPGLTFNKNYDERFGKKTRNIITHPLLIHNDLIGVFQVVNKIGSNFDATDQMILKNFSLVAGIAIMNAKLMERVIESQAGSLDIIENISDRVIIQDKQGHIIHMNCQAISSLPNHISANQAIGKKFTDVFPELKSLKKEIASIVSNRINKAISGGNFPYVILATKNFKHEIEKIILILKKTDSIDLPDPEQYVKD